MCCKDRHPGTQLMARCMHACIHVSLLAMQSVATKHTLPTLPLKRGKPVFQRRYFPCTVQWFLERCELQLVRKGWRRRVQRVLRALGAVDGNALGEAQAWFAEQKERLRRHHFMLLRLVDPAHRVGQPDRLNQARMGLLLHACPLVACDGVCWTTQLPRQRCMHDTKAKRCLLCGSWV